jgi:DNA-directed RNA polymerase specialized sigma24 family protein
LENRSDPGQWDLAEVARRCAQETTRFFRGQDSDARFCYELFRRALLEHDEGAWELLYTQYGPLIAGWVKRHPAFPSSGEDSAYFVNRALEKLWAAVPPERFSRFPDLPALLRYLQMCVHSAILDHVRRTERLAVCVLDDVGAAGNPADVTVEDEVLAHSYREEFWREIERRLHGEKERCVVYGAFVLALKPRELLARFPNTFRDVREVYGIKENVLARLSRDDDLRKLLGLDA